MFDADFALFNANQLVTAAPGCHPKARGELGLIERAALAASGSKIVWVGPMDEFHDAVQLTPDATLLNTHGRTVLPGFVDSHTHPVFAGDRTSDFYARARGERYSDQVEEGGIMRTVRATRDADEDSLLNLAFGRAETFLRHGTTTIGARTGYGLSLEPELKSLRVLNRLQHLQPLKVVPGFLGAHVFPQDYPGSVDAFLSEVADSWLHAVREYAPIVDTWADEEAFTTEQCRMLLGRAQQMGFSLTLHANELGPGGGIRLAAELRALSVDHAVYADAEDIAALRESGTVAVLLPGTTLFLGSDTYAPARALIDGGATVALGTDFNPGTCFTQNMQFILTLAVLKMKMSPEEAILAATTHAAHALGMQDRVGSIEPGKFCDLSVFGVADYRTIPYSMAMNLVETVVASGQVVVRDGMPTPTTRGLVPAS